jgi:hypothetical protein
VPFRSLFAEAYVACSLSANCGSEDSGGNSITSAVDPSHFTPLVVAFSDDLIEELVFSVFELASELHFLESCSRSESTAKLKNILL